MADSFQTLQLTNFTAVAEPQLYYDDSDGRETLKNDLLRAISRLRPSDYDPESLVFQVDRLTGVNQGQTIDTLLTIDWNDIDLPDDDNDDSDDDDHLRGPELSTHCQTLLGSLFD